MAMTEIQYLFSVLAEEASEIAKEAIKCQRFTPDHVHDGQSNLQRLCIELAQLDAVATMLRVRGVNVGTAGNVEDFSKKLRDTNKYMQLSREMGVVEPKED